MTCEDEKWSMTNTSFDPKNFENLRELAVSGITRIPAAKNGAG